MTIQSQSITTAVHNLEGIFESEESTIESMIYSIAIPRQFKQDLFEDYLDDEVTELIKAALTEKELAYIVSKDHGYIKDLGGCRNNDAKQLGEARSAGTLIQYLDSHTINTSMISRAENTTERNKLLSVFTNDIREKYQATDLGLSTAIPCILDSFLWRPAKQYLSDYVQDEEELEYLGEVIGLELGDDASFLELAFYWGILYNLFPNDSYVQVISTDSGAAWENVTNEGNLETFLSEFLTTQDIVHCLSKYIN